VSGPENLGLGKIGGEVLMRRLANRFVRLVRRLARDRDGIGAIEFAILVPVLLLLYLGALQTTIALSIAQRASRAAGTVADVLTQQTSVTKSTLATMPSLANAIFSPYVITGMTLKITGIQIDASSKATVLWSWEQDGTTAYTANSVVTGVPADLNKASSFLVRTELAVPYSLISFGPNFLPSGMNSITIRRQYFYRQRTGTSITCSDC
jgi:Flp pilus assembly protein TadG